MNNIKDQLKQLRAIEPDRDFAIRAKFEILAPTKSRGFSLFPKLNIHRNVMLAWSGAGLTVMLLLVIAVPLFFPKPSMSASLSTETLINEYGNLPINIQLKEIKYDQTVNQTISSAITEVSNTKTKHLNSDILSSEAQNATIKNVETQNVDALLNQAINN